MNEDGFAGNLTWTATDGHGRSRLALRDGRYVIRAKKESEGYPDPNSLLSVDESAMFPEVTISKQDVTGVTVRMGLKGAILEGDVHDKASTIGIEKAKITSKRRK